MGRRHALEIAAPAKEDRGPFGGDVRIGKLGRDLAVGKISQRPADGWDRGGGRLVSSGRHIGHSGGGPPPSDELQSLSDRDCALGRVNAWILPILAPEV